MRRVALIAGLAAFAGLVGAPASEAGRNCSNVVLGTQDSGRTLKLHKCDRVTISLQEASDGGYRWTVAHAPSKGVLKLVTQSEGTDVAPPAVGGYSTHSFVYEAVGKGSTSLKLVEARSFEKHSKIGGFKLSVRVS